jgi:uncharacterized RDD family membrane protein YckC
VPTRELADWWTRAGAFVIDQLIVGAVALALSFAVTGAVHQPGQTQGSLAFYAVVAAVASLYAPLLMARSGARNGQTLGKQLVGIRVVRTDGQPVGFWLGVLRTVVAQQLLIGLTFYLYAIVDYLWPLRDPQSQALHDKIARTWVLRTTVPADAPPPQPVEASVGEWLPPRAPGT